MKEYMAKENNNLETLKKQSKWGGKRPGAGMPKGMKTKRTRERAEAEEYFRKRVLDSIEGLVDSQMNLAKGCQYLFKLKKIYLEKEDKFVVPKGVKPEIVKDQTEIARYLAGDFDESDECDYYFMTTEKPDNRALDSLVDRVFGKAKQNIAIEGNLTISGVLNKLKEDYVRSSNKESTGDGAKASE